MQTMNSHRMTAGQCRRIWSVGVVTLAWVLVCSAIPARAGNIFDDDWTPPKPVGQPYAEAAKPPPAVPPAVAPATQPAPAVPPPALPTAEPVAPPRLPIPAKADQAHSRALLKEVYAKQIMDRSLAGRNKLARTLFDQASKIADNPTDRFVLRVGAMDAAREAENLELCFQAADLIAEQYDVDALSVKADMVLKSNLHGESPAITAANVNAALDLIDPLLAADDVQTAEKVLALARPLAAHNGPLASAVRDRAQAVEAERVTHDRLVPSIEKLKTVPDDPAANLVIGSFLCFSKGDWPRGLPMLAKGSDPTLKQLAILELSIPGKPVDLNFLADGWWDFGGKELPATRAKIHLHAAAFYKTALEGAIGLRRALLQRRIAEAAADVAGQGVPSGNGQPGVVAPKHVTIVKAQYGGAGRMISIAPQIQAALDADPYTPIYAGNSWHGDPAPSQHKQLELKYRCDGKEYEITVQEDSVCVVPPIADAGVKISGSPRPFRIIAARYGTDARWVDVTATLQQQVRDGSSVIPVSNELAGVDPHSGKHKYLVVWYESGGRRYARIAVENASMTFR